jgi:hypothetical protein
MNSDAQACIVSSSVSEYGKLRCADVHDDTELSMELPAL